MKSTMTRRPIHMLWCCLGGVDRHGMDTFLNPFLASSQGVKFSGTFAWVRGDTPPAWRAVVLNWMVWQV